MTPLFGAQDHARDFENDGDEAFSKGDPHTGSDKYLKAAEKYVETNRPNEAIECLEDVSKKLKNTDEESLLRNRLDSLVRLATLYSINDPAKAADNYMEAARICYNLDELDEFSSHLDQSLLLYEKLDMNHAIISIGAEFSKKFPRMDSDKDIQERLITCYDRILRAANAEGKKAVASYYRNRINVVEGYKKKEGSKLSIFR